MNRTRFALITLAALLMTMLPSLAVAGTNHGWGTPIAENFEFSGYADFMHVTWENTPEQNDPFQPDYCPDFPGCNTNLPLNGGNNPVLTDSFLDRVRCGHTGRGLSCIERFCIGAIHEDDGANDYIARGYITIDNVRDCNLLFPSQAGYFGTQGFALDVNQLWGDWFIVQEGRAIGDTLVAIEAYNETQYPMQAFGAGNYTFYGRYVAGLGTDQREPLATTWATRYFKPNPLFDGGTDLLVWRDSKCQTTSSSYQHQIAGQLTPLDPTDDAYDCRPSASAIAPVPPWYPLDETQVVSFDTQEDAFEICGAFQIGGPVSPPGTTTIEDFCFPLETGRYSVSEGDLADIPYDFGWLYLNLNFTLGNTQANPPTCTTDGLFGDVAQSWVISELDSEGIFSVGYAGTQLASACLPARRNYASGPNGGDNNVVITGDLN